MVEGNERLIVRIAVPRPTMMNGAAKSFLMYLTVLPSNILARGGVLPVMLGTAETRRRHRSGDGDR